MDKLSGAVRALKGLKRKEISQRTKSERGNISTIYGGAHMERSRSETEIHLTPGAAWREENPANMDVRSLESFPNITRTGGGAMESEGTVGRPQAHSSKEPSLAASDSTLKPSNNLGERPSISDGPSVSQARKQFEEGPNRATKGPRHSSGRPGEHYPTKGFRKRAEAQPEVQPKAGPSRQSRASEAEKYQETLSASRQELPRGRTNSSVSGLNSGKPTAEETSSAPSLVNSQHGVLYGKTTNLDGTRRPENQLIPAKLLEKQSKAPTVHNNRKGSAKSSDSSEKITAINVYEQKTNLDQTSGESHQNQTHTISKQFEEAINEMDIRCHEIIKTSQTSKPKQRARQHQDTMETVPSVRGIVEEAMKACIAKEKGREYLANTGLNQAETEFYNHMVDILAKACHVPMKTLGHQIMEIGTVDMDAATITILTLHKANKINKKEATWLKQRVVGEISRETYVEEATSKTREAENEKANEGTKEQKGMETQEEEDPSIRSHQTHRENKPTRESSTNKQRGQKAAPIERQQTDAEPKFVEQSTFFSQIPEGRGLSLITDCSVEIETPSRRALVRERKSSKISEAQSVAMEEIQAHTDRLTKGLKQEAVKAGEEIGIQVRKAGEEISSQAKLAVKTIEEAVGNLIIKTTENLEVRNKELSQREERVSRMEDDLIRRQKFDEPETLIAKTNRKEKHEHSGKKPQTNEKTSHSRQKEKSTKGRQCRSRGKNDNDQKREKPSERQQSEYGERGSREDKGGETEEESITLQDDSTLEDKPEDKKSKRRPRKSKKTSPPPPPSSSDDDSASSDEDDGDKQRKRKSKRSNKKDDSGNSGDDSSDDEGQREYKAKSRKNGEKIVIIQRNDGMGPMMKWVIENPPSPAYNFPKNPLSNKRSLAERLVFEIEEKILEKNLRSKEALHYIKKLFRLRKSAEAQIEEIVKESCTTKGRITDFQKKENRMQLYRLLVEEYEPDAHTSMVSMQDHETICDLHCKITQQFFFEDETRNYTLKRKERKALEKILKDKGELIKDKRLRWELIEAENAQNILERLRNREEVEIGRFLKNVNRKYIRKYWSGQDGMKESGRESTGNDKRVYALTTDPPTETTERENNEEETRESGGFNQRTSYKGANQRETTNTYTGYNKQNQDYAKPGAKRNSRTYTNYTPKPSASRAKGKSERREYSDTDPQETATVNTLRELGIPDRRFGGYTPSDEKDKWKSPVDITNQYSTGRGSKSDITPILGTGQVVNPNKAAPDAAEHEKRTVGGTIAWLSRPESKNW